MASTLSIQHNLFRTLERTGDRYLPTLARLVFGVTLYMYFLNSAMTKLGGEGFNALFAPTAGMFGQMLPSAADAAGYDVALATGLQKLIMLAGTWAEFILPALVLIGLFTRFAAIGMVGFLAVMTYVDLFGHGGISDPAVLGAWFDADTTGIVMDQRIYWVFLLMYLFFQGGGALSVDRLFTRRQSRSRNL